MQQILAFGAYTVRLFPGEGSRDVLYCPLFAEEAAAVWQRLPASRPVLAAVSGMDWNRDLSPWPAAKAFRDGEDFSGGGARFLGELSSHIIPSVEAALGFAPASRAVCGYSLAGLFALWAAWQTDLFDRAASVSGSLWFDGFVDFLRQTPPRRRLRKVYLSLGDREKNAKDPRMAAVEDCTRRAAALLRDSGAAVELEMNPGGHFRDAAARMAKGIAALYRV